MFDKLSASQKGLCSSSCRCVFLVWS